jgi:hypothetical protein
MAVEVEGRPLEDDDVACAWSCGRGPSEEEAELGVLHPRGSCPPVLRVHVVALGETLESIAREYGFDDYRRLYDARVNPELVAARPNPDRIYEGDREQARRRRPRDHSCALARGGGGARPPPSPRPELECLIPRDVLAGERGSKT